MDGHGPHQLSQLRVELSQLRVRSSARSSSYVTTADGGRECEVPIGRSDTAPPALETDAPTPLAERARSNGRGPTTLATHPRRWSLTCANFLCGRFSVLMRAVRTARSACPDSRARQSAAGSRPPSVRLRRLCRQRPECPITIAVGTDSRRSFTLTPL
jgi:hypothetical protein